MRLAAAAFFCAALTLTGLTLNGCGASPASDTLTNLTISGVIATSRDQRLVWSRDLTVYTVRCMTLTGTPQSGEGTVSSDGSFSLDIASAVDVPIGCFVLEGDDIIATVAFESATTGMDGENTREGSYVAGEGGALEFGTVTLNLDEGTATVEKSAISGGASENASGVGGEWPHSVTGTWNVTSCKSMPSGVDCPTGDGRLGRYFSREGGGGVPESVFLHEMGPATDGDSNVHYGLSVWKSEEAALACGTGGELSEGVDLPLGWSTSDLSLERALVLDAFDTTFAAYKARNFGDNKTTCNAVHTGGSMTCAAVTNAGSWGNGTPYTFSDNDCKAMCAANAGGNEMSGSCPRRMQSDWAKTSVLNGTTNALSCSGTGCVAGAAGSFISLGDRPDNRFVSNEMVIVGNTGTVVDYKTENQYACVRDNPGDANCTQIACQVTEKNVVAAQFSSATAGTISVSISHTAKGINGTLTSACLDTTKVDNHIARRVGEAQNMVLIVAKDTRSK